MSEKILSPEDISNYEIDGMSLGEKFGERAYGSFCYDYTIRTFANYNSTDLDSKEFDKQVSHVDFIPTILEHLEIKEDKNYEKMDGVSLLNAMKGEQFNERYVFTETGNPLNEQAPPKKPNTESIRTSQWKLIYNEHNNTKELYNLEQDPNENENLIGNGLEIENILWEELLKIQKIS